MLLQQITFALLLLPGAEAIALTDASRRHVVRGLVASSALLAPRSAHALKDCFQDCSQNCDRVAPRSGRYCEQSCGEYCVQDDRRDGLSGSVDSSQGEVGLASAYDLVSKITGAPPQSVPYGQDKPPTIGGAFGAALSQGLQQVVNPSTGTTR